jgi:hypothetical protein
MSTLTLADERTLANIALVELGFTTLETRNSDALDFRDCAVWNAREALKRAFLAGCASAAKGSGGTTPG